MKEGKPVLGSTVHYVTYNDPEGSSSMHVVGTITQVDEKKSQDLRKSSDFRGWVIALALVPEELSRHSVMQDENEKKPGTWHYIEEEVSESISSGLKGLVESTKKRLREYGSILNIFRRK